jgi:hypothetical protein
MKGVYDGIMDSFTHSGKIEEYDLYHVVNPPVPYSPYGENVTRIAYAVKK